MISNKITTLVMTVGVSAIIVLAGVISGHSVMGQNRGGGQGILSIHCNGMPAPLNQNDTSAFKRLLSLFENSILDSSQVPHGWTVDTAELDDSVNNRKVICAFMSLQCDGFDPGQLCRTVQMTPNTNTSNP